ncbi:NADP-specific glutamate dehydrogenase [Lentibacillus saliphilus]|uniref:NADP-specific glutamate dehydrogenase n=1 Tax=Lentibacillus saliphilus TaxID=2737028 RepID=UPI001FE5B40A|nr:NADP-specific glutamate dehydrogenase [Lentibacillus saliphilus]
MSHTIMQRDYQTEQRAQAYIDEVFSQIKQRDPHETEFHQAVDVIFKSIKPALVKNPAYIDNRILERLTEPERLITFRVPWVDDEGTVQVNRGFRVQFNSAIGPYKGGLRFHPTVNSSVVKFLGFQQIFKNALTGQPIGGGKGGADFDPKGKSDGEIMRFCQSFMTESSQHIGPDTDVPAGDIGVGARELGYLFGQYKKLRGRFEAGALTGKSLNFGGSLGRKEATGYGTIYFVENMMKDKGLNIEGKRVVVSGSGNVSIHAMEKAIELGAIVVACSDSDGYIHDENGIHLETVKQLKEIENRRIRDYVDYHPQSVYVEGCSGIWTIPCEIALPCATQNEISGSAAQTLIKNGVKVVAEGANMPSTTAAVEQFIASDILYAPAKAANAGGVAVSSLEMAQNSSRIAWTFEEVDKKLKDIMTDIYHNCSEAAKAYSAPGNLVVGANIAGFIKVADAMTEQGVI